MAEYFEEAEWSQILAQPDWYVRLHGELISLQRKWLQLERAGEHNASNAMKLEVRSFFSRAMVAGKLPLGNSGPNFDEARKPIDTVIVHHTSAEPGYDMNYMNATQLLNVYVPYYFNDPEHLGLKGQGIWSNHLRNGRPVFYLYHWLMRMDGTFERILDDGELGWHAANWDINCRSVGICLDNDYEGQDPDYRTVERLGRFIAEYYPQVGRDRIFGHGEVSRHPTICPGSGFASGWKRQLVEAV